MAEKSSPLMARISNHFRTLATREIEVPEWGESEEKPLIIYGAPMNVMAAEKIFNAVKTSSFDMFVEAMIQLARDEKGDPLFTIADRPNLRRVGAKDVVERVGSELIRPRNGDDVFPTQEARIKN